MGLLATKKDSDPRLKAGAYVRKGLVLYRVVSCTAVQILLEDAFLSNSKDQQIISTTNSDFLTHYELVREAVRPSK